jgi:hypothetical protein
MGDASSGVVRALFPCFVEYESNFKSEPLVDYTVCVRLPLRTATAAAPFPLSLPPSLRPSVPPSLRPSLPLRVCVCARARAVRLGRMQRDPHTRCGGCRAHTEIPIFAVTLYLGMIFYLPQHLGEAPGKGIVRKAWGIWNLLLSIFRRAARTLPLC